MGCIRLFPRSVHFKLRKCWSRLHRSFQLPLQVILEIVGTIHKSSKQRADLIQVLLTHTQ